MSLTIRVKAEGDKPAMGWNTHVEKDGVDLNRQVQRVDIHIAADDLVKATVYTLPQVLDIDVEEKRVTVKCAACGCEHDCATFAKKTDPAWKVEDTPEGKFRVEIDKAATDG